LSKILDGFVEHLSPTEGAQQSVIQFMAMTAVNLVTPKAAAMDELLFNKPACDFVVLLKSDLDVQHTHL